MWWHSGQFPPPLNHFETVQEVELARILNNANESEEAYSLEIVLKYPGNLHDGQLVFLLASTTMQISYTALGEKQNQLLQLMDEKPSEKMIEALLAKKELHSAHSTLYIT